MLIRPALQIFQFSLKPCQIINPAELYISLSCTCKVSLIKMNSRRKLILWRRKFKFCIVQGISKLASTPILQLAKKTGNSYIKI